MSVTYSIGCIICKKVLWIGQNHTLYDSQEVDTMQFLKDHAKHNLVFDEDCNSDTFEDFTEVDNEYKLKED